MSLRVAVPSPSFCEHPALCAELLALFPDAKLNRALVRLDGAALIDFLRGHDVAVVGLEHITQAVIDALPDLKIVSKLGTGVDMIDGGALARRGIRFGWRPGANALSIAELVVAFALVALRHAARLNIELRAGRAPAQRMGRLLSGRTIGLHGFGHIGQQVARLLEPYECTLLVCDTADRSEACARWSATPVGFDELCARADVLSIHVPLTPTTRDLYDASILARMRPAAVLINTARGELVDETALLAHLRANPAFSACADVFRSEPAFASPLIGEPNFFATPHIGGSAAEARLAMGRIAIDGITDNFIPVPGQYPFDAEPAR